MLSICLFLYQFPISLEFVAMLVNDTYYMVYIPDEFTLL